MSILLDSTTKVVVQGITGREGSFHAGQMIEMGTKQPITVKIEARTVCFMQVVYGKSPSFIPSAIPEVSFRVKTSARSYGS